MKTYLCYRTEQIEKVKTELNKRLEQSNGNSIEITMKSGIMYLIGKRIDDYQIYYLGNKYTGDEDCDLVAEVYSDWELAEFVISHA